MIHAASWKFGIRCYERIRLHSILGFSRTYESDDPITSIWIEPDDVKIVRLQQLCEAAGVVFVADGRWRMFGRESILRSVAAGKEPLDGAIALRGFLSDFNASQSEQTEQRLKDCRMRMVSPLRLAHKVAEVYPQLRNWDHGTEAEIVLHNEVGVVQICGVLK